MPTPTDIRPDVIPPKARAAGYVGAVVVNAGLVLAEGLGLITPEHLIAGLTSLGILTAGLALGHTPTTRTTTHEE